MVSQKADRADFVFKKKIFLVQDTRNVDCTAQIKTREVLAFPEYKVSRSEKTIFAVYRPICSIARHTLESLYRLCGSTSVDIILGIFGLPVYFCKKSISRFNVIF